MGDTLVIDGHHFTLAYREGTMVTLRASDRDAEQWAILHLGQYITVPPCGWQLYVWSYADSLVTMIQEG